MIGLNAYHRLPPALRSVAASARGYYLRSWRYGGDAEQLVEQALERERWSPARWESWRTEKLVRLLDRAARRVPYYREHWRKRRLNGDSRTSEDLRNWPILEKEHLRENPSAFLADDFDVRGLFQEHTSGTTGKPLTIWLSRQAVREWFALYEARWRRWYGVSRQKPWALFGGQLVTPISEVRPPFWVWNRGLNQLYLSSYHLKPEWAPQYLEAIRNHGVEHIIGYTSALMSLAQGAISSGAAAPRQRVIISQAEPLLEFQRKLLQQVFQCPVRETYGLTEIVAAASECEAGSLHLWPEAGWMEVCSGERSLGNDEVGDLVCTGLLNDAMPLVRYRAGDRGSLTTSHCDCGRGLPRLRAVEGRRDDALFTKDGREIGRLDPVFKADFSILEAQIAQTAADEIRIRVVPGPGFDVSQQSALIRRVKDRMGDITVHVERVDAIPRGPNGKFRAVVREFSPAR